MEGKIRDSGYYWLLEGEDWVIGFYYSKTKKWQLIGTAHYYPEEYFKKIGDKVKRPSQ